MINTVKTELGGRTLEIETGKLANQAGGAVTVRYGDTILLVTATSRKEPTPNASFFPLTVMYQEKTYAAGKIPGGFFKREGRPRDLETLTGRLTDRPIRPLFPKEFTNETQVLVTVLSSDMDNEPDILAITGASAALMISPMPFKGPIASVKVGRIDGNYKINPTPEEMENSDINIVVAASRESVVMVEGAADIVPEKDVLDAIKFAHKEMQPLFDMQDELVKKCGKEKWTVAEAVVDEDLVKKVNEFASSKMEDALSIDAKLDRYAAIDVLKKETIEALTTEENVEELSSAISGMLGSLKSELARKRIFEGKRIGGRGPKDIRNIECEVGLLPRVHGSALFTRGETQAIAAATLGTADDKQRIDDLAGEYKKHFMLHYNFPPYSVGEVKRIMGPSRREIGHGALAERSIMRVLPSTEDCPYTMRVVSEVLASNGSSSMATVCAGSLSLMDAGINLKNPIAGIAMGLVIDEKGKYVVLSDILGDEDHFGDMDFKVTGTKDGVAALQMDIKVDGISEEILEEALNQAREGRIHILGEMAKTLSEGRTEISEYAPKLLSVQIDPAKIKDLIGAGGKTINKIIDLTGAKINVDDEGNVQVACQDREAADSALKMVKAVTTAPKVGAYYKGSVARILEFGAIVKILPNADGMVHISMLDNKRVEKVEDVVQEGEEVVVKVLEIDVRNRRIRLSRVDAIGHESEVEDVEVF